MRGPAERVRQFATAVEGRGPRLLSLVLAALALLAIVLHPAVLGENAPYADRTALALALVGGIGGTAHGIGHQSQSWLLRRAAVPWIAWAMMAAGSLWLALSGICCGFVM